MNEIALDVFTNKKENYELLDKWCSQEYIYEWFEQRKLTYSEIENKYQQKLLAKKQALFFINYDTKHIGFVQIYKYDDKIVPVLNNNDKIYEYDIFIGDDKYLSRGIGKEIVSYINKYIYQNYLCDYIVLRPFKRNKRAINCYLKCNFKVIYEYMGKDTLGNREEVIVLLNKPNSKD